MTTLLFLRLIRPCRTTVGMNILTLVLSYAPVPPIYKAMFTIPNIALQSVMACRAFRQLRLAATTIEISTEDEWLSPMHFASRKLPAGSTNTMSRFETVLDIRNDNSEDIELGKRHQVA